MSVNVNERDRGCGVCLWRPHFSFLSWALELTGFGLSHTCRCDENSTETHGLLKKTEVTMLATGCKVQNKL